MLSKLVAYTNRKFLKEYLVCITVSLAFAPSGGAPSLRAQAFSSGSDGSDGALDYSSKPPGTYNFDPTQFHGSQVQYGIFNFTTINIPSGITLQVFGNLLNSPVFWLATGNVTIGGVLNLSGGNGASYGVGSFGRVPSVPGSGGYAGGIG